MAKKPQELEAWGRNKARSRYAEGGEILEPASADRNAEIDAFISEVMRDQINKMRDSDD